MKNFTLIFILFILVKTSMACSCADPLSFCAEHSYYDLTASCLFVDTIDNGVKLKILSILNGTEENETITLWDFGGPYNMCNDSTYESKAKNIGNIGDTVIISMNKVDTIKSAWDVIGDYRYNGFNCNIDQLNVKNGIVTGFISGSRLCHYNNSCLNTYGYNDFIKNYKVNNMNCVQWESSDEIIEPNPVHVLYDNSKRAITIDSELSGEISVVNQLGQIIFRSRVQMVLNKFSTLTYSPGVYIVLVNNTFNLKSKKFLVGK